MILKKETIEQLSKELSLPFTGIEQDWNIEMANSNRINDFLEFYNKSNLSNEKKVAVISLILASYEDFLNESGLKIDDRWNSIKSILESNRDIFADQMVYWSLNNEEEEENSFQIAPLIRAIKWQ